MPSTIRCDIAIVGGGLAGGLIALALRRKRPNCVVRLIEETPHIGGNHLWSFFASDVAPADRWLVAPLICHGWTRYDVAFPAHRRTLKAPYYSIESSRFEQVVTSALAKGAALCGRKVVDLNSTTVVLADGDTIEARGVIDARGPGDLFKLECGWQKFLGRELSLQDPHDVERPMVMDGSVEQIDGYRFMYALPFTPMQIFLEDTYYSDTPDIDAEALGARIDAYVAARGWRVDRQSRQEAGVLPVALGGDFDAYWQSSGDHVAKAGVRAGLFHPLTSYSLPDAVRTATLIAESRVTDGKGLHDLLYRYAKAEWRKRRFYRMLAKMLFKAAEPSERYKVLERFYRLDEGLVARFYAAQSTLLDRARVLTGKPPVPVGKAVRVLGGWA